MNNERRKSLRAILDDLEKAEGLLSEIFGSYHFDKTAHTP